MKRWLWLLALLPLCGCGGTPAKTRLELFVVSLAEDEAVQYVRRQADLNGSDPDGVARRLIGGISAPVLLHSTSWRWEKDGSIVLTYLAYCEKADFGPLQPVRLRWDDFAPAAATDPLHPRPAVIREGDVLGHGLRHFSFLVRYARDERVAAGLSPRSLTFFRAMCGQLAGRLDAARQFEECSAVKGR